MHRVAYFLLLKKKKRNWCFPVRLQSKHALAQSWGRLFGWVPCLMPLTLCQLPPQGTKLLWRSPTALIQFYSRSTPAHKCCKPIRPMLFISPLGAISLPNFERNPASFFPPFLIIPHWLYTLSLSPPIPLHSHSVKILKTTPSGCLFVFMQEKQVFVFSWAVISGQQLGVDLSAD